MLNQMAHLRVMLHDSALGHKQYADHIEGAHVRAAAIYRNGADAGTQSPVAMSQRAEAIAAGLVVSSAMGALTPSSIRDIAAWHYAEYLTATRLITLVDALPEPIAQGWSDSRALLADDWRPSARDLEVAEATISLRDFIRHAKEGMQEQMLYAARFIAKPGARFEVGTTDHGERYCHPLARPSSHAP